MPHPMATLCLLRGQDTDCLPGAWVSHLKASPVHGFCLEFLVEVRIRGKWENQKVDYLVNCLWAVISFGFNTISVLCRRPSLFLSFFVFGNTGV